MESNKKLTIGEVEELRDVMNVAIADAIKTFEDATGIRTAYIEVQRSKDKEREEGKLSCPCDYDEDRGEVTSVTVNLNMEL